eukprot:30845-Pelagococcus_subviridis.AAC.8
MSSRRPDVFRRFCRSNDSKRRGGAGRQRTVEGVEGRSGRENEGGGRGRRRRARGGRKRRRASAREVPPFPPRTTLREPKPSRA